MKRKKTERRRTIGGDVIGRGGYGCVFLPALKCKNKKTRSKKKVSKLMKKRYAESEYKEIQKFRKLLKNVPNYKKYYIIDDIEQCKPDKLTKQDLKNFDDTCIPLLKIGITKKTINEKLDRFEILNIPNGGINFDEYITKTNKNIQSINPALIDLLKNGILPMNELNVYHNDVKESNILIDFNGNCRLIDWGISVITTGDTIPKNMTNRPFQYNSPFSTILWNDDFTRMYDEFLKKFEKSESSDYFIPKMTFYDVREFLKIYVYFWNEKRGRGHLDVILSIISMLQDYEIDGMNVIINYLSVIVFTFTKNNKNRLMEYFKEIYLKNVDIWGFIMMYPLVLEKIKNSEVKYNKTAEIIQYIIKKYLLRNPTYVINMENLMEDLKKM